MRPCSAAASAAAVSLGAGAVGRPWPLATHPRPSCFRPACCVLLGPEAALPRTLLRQIIKALNPSPTSPLATAEARSGATEPLPARCPPARVLLARAAWERTRARTSGR